MKKLTEEELNYLFSHLLLSGTKQQAIIKFNIKIKGDN
jgi:hypothetical protein